MLRPRRERGWWTLLKDENRKVSVALIVEDDGSEETKARSLVEKLITEDKVDLLWVPTVVDSPLLRPRRLRPSRSIPDPCGRR